MQQRRESANLERRRVVLLGLEHPRAIAAISSIGEIGVEVIGVDCQPSLRANASRYLRRTYRISAEPTKILEFLLVLGEHGGGILITSSAEYSILVSQNAEALSRHFVLSVPPWDILRPLIDLKSSYHLARECGLRTPEVFQAHTGPELRSLVSVLDFEHCAYLLRTPPGTVPADTQTGRFTIAAGGSAQAVLEKCFLIYSRLKDFPAIAEVIPPAADQSIGVFMIVDADHEAVSVTCIRRFTPAVITRNVGFIHPYDLGSTAFCETFRDDEAIAAAERFVRHARYRGPISIEFLRDPRDGGLVFIKADTHLIREMSLSRAVGVDAALALYRALAGGEYPRVDRHREGVGWLWLTNYLDVLWRHRASPPIRRELLGLLKRFPHIRALAYWDPRDPQPFLLDSGFWLKDALFGGLRYVEAGVRKYRRPA